MNNTFTIAKKEYKDIFQSNLFLVVLVFFSILTITSVLVSTLVFQSQVTEYQSSLEILKEMGKTPSGPPPQLFPLNLFRGVVDYIEIIGAILGILLGYISIAKEKNARAIKLILTRPVNRMHILFGKIIGNAIFISALLIVVGIFAWLSVFLIGGVALTGSEVIKLLLTLTISSLYILIFFCISAFFSIYMKNISHALIILFVIWLLFALLIPQIGDTMDPDNQVPGGFFKSMNMNKTQEKQVLVRFNSYEKTRNFIEELSITKHYERASFALLGIKNEFNNMPIRSILNKKWMDIGWIVVFLFFGIIANYFILNRRNALSGGIE